MIDAPKVVIYTMRLYVYTIVARFSICKTAWGSALLVQLDGQCEGLYMRDEF